MTGNEGITATGLRSVAKILDKMPLLQKIHLGGALVFFGGRGSCLYSKIDVLVLLVGLCMLGEDSFPLLEALSSKPELVLLELHGAVLLVAPTTFVLMNLCMWEGDCPPSLSHALSLSMNVNMHVPVFLSERDCCGF